VGRYSQASVSVLAAWLRILNCNRVNIQLRAEHPEYMTGITSAEIIPMFYNWAGLSR